MILRVALSFKEPSQPPDGKFVTLTTFRPRGICLTVIYSVPYTGLPPPPAVPLPAPSFKGLQNVLDLPARDPAQYLFRPGDHFMVKEMQHGDGIVHTTIPESS